MDVVLGFYLAFAIMAAGIAPSKGRRWWVWLAVGLLFGPVGSFAVVFMGKVYHCVECDRKISPNARLCPYCQSSQFESAME